MDNKKANILKIVENQIKKYSNLMIVVLSIILFLIIGAIITWWISPDTVSEEHEIYFYIFNGLMALITSAIIIILIVNKKHPISTKSIAIIYHIYATLLIFFATLIFIFDLTIGLAPIFYLLILTFVVGLFTIEPRYSFIICLISLFAIIVAIIIQPEIYLFSNDKTLMAENIIGLIFFILLLSTISFKNYRISKLECEYQEKLLNLSYKDELTGLLNERSYINEIEAIDKRIKDGEKVEFAIVMMDVNNLKATNDKYGHRYGCSLIVRCGHTLPNIFKTSKLFHVGGDEFIAIIYGKDYENFDEVIKEYDEKMIYSIVQYEGVDLIFSVARGYAKYNNEKCFRETLQIADDAMYENKIYVKEKYNLKKR